MKKLEKLPQKKTLKRYDFKETFASCSATSDPDPTSTITISTTHIWKK